MQISDVLVIGGGPSGLAAAATLASEGRSVVLLERNQQLGGQAGTTSAIENYLSHSLISGPDFANLSCAHCIKFGVKIEYGVAVYSIEQLGGGMLRVHAAQTGEVFRSFDAHAIILATGLTQKRLGIHGDDLPHVHYGMRMDALPVCSGRKVVLVGGGNSAGQAAVHYLDRGADVALVVRKPLEETMSHYLIDYIRDRGGTEVYADDVQAIHKSGILGTMSVYLSRGFTLYYVDCVHIFIGQEPDTEWLRGKVLLDADDYILTDSQHRTNARGIFAVGDVEFGSVKRVACAVGRGNEVVPAVHRYLDGLEFTNYSMKAVIQ